MRTSTLTRPTPADRALPVRAAVGSYVDTDGVRRAPARAGSYTGTSPVVGSYTGTPAAAGSYVRTGR